MTSWRRSSSASPPLPTSLAPPPRASPSAASSPAHPSCAATAPSSRRYSSASSTPRDSIPSRRPHPNAPAARAPARAADFSFDYLPRAEWHCWNLCDVGDGRVLIEFVRITKDEKDSVFVPDLAVCDPLSRRYLLLPPVPGDLLASVEVQKENIVNFEAFLVPSGDGEEVTSFRVIRSTLGVTRLVVFVFSSGSGRWSVGTSTSWDALSLDEPHTGFAPNTRHYVYGCFYWRVKHWDKLLKLDMSIMEFSTDDLPPDHNERTIAIVEAGEGKVAMFSRINQGTSLDYYTFLQNGSEKANEWHMKNTIPLPAHYTCYLRRAAEGHIFLLGMPKVQDMVHAACFSLEIKTFNIERVSRIRHPYHCGFPYFGFPPSMSPRRIQGYEVMQD